MEDKGCFVSFVQTYLIVSFLVLMITVVVFLVWEREGRLLLGRKRKAGELFLHLLFVSCLQLKLILMPKWHILGWHTLVCLTRLLAIWKIDLNLTPAMSINLIHLHYLYCLVLSDFSPLSRYKMIPCVFSFSLLLIKSGFSSYLLGISPSKDKNKIIKPCQKPLKKWKNIPCECRRIQLAPNWCIDWLPLQWKSWPFFVYLQRVALSWIWRSSGPKMAKLCLKKNKGDFQYQTSELIHKV